MAYGACDPLDYGRFLVYSVNFFMFFGDIIYKNMCSILQIMGYIVINFVDFAD